ncbi:hypothetical protein LCGC14_1279910 [marine sediment metagenome]|uniref:Uncharacterized protein n=1 Tax=marine sediment metagenome TaxID=412755 RepID=A0A0F9NC70_9ZZZZ|nr:MAG: hypothetical protein Lokiarch_38780 [Candidatus Lokiarchaeum sp. GC14_75]HDZ18412.1 hypothetical protein [archaeon]HEC40042.1 hypothetical protein [bacterium]
MAKKIFMTIWRNKWLTSHATTIDDFINTFEALARKFKEWREWGIQLLDNGGAKDDYATFIINNMDVAIKAGFTFKNGDGVEFLETLSGEEIQISKK